MTESEWLSCKDPGAMLEFLRGKVSDRKLRLFAAAGLRSVWRLLTDPGCRAAVEIAERFADGQATAKEMADASDPLWNIVNTHLGGPLRCMVGEAGEVSRSPERFRVDLAAWSPGYVCAKHLDQGTMPGHWEAWEIIRDEHLKDSSDRLRHLIGNPFRPYPTLASWPSLVLDLAQQLYDGADVCLVLHDALLDAGHQELAEHFRNDEWHPKGCWALDAILGRS